MHFEFLVEDVSGKIAVETLVEKILGSNARDCVAFKNKLLDLLSNCNPAPMTLFRIAVEEMEAWLLGCRGAVTTAYPKARKHILAGYKQDSVCKTWELLADAIHKGGATALKKEGWPAPGRAKCEWARQIAPHIDVDANKSPSFGVFRDGIRRLAKVAVGS